MEETFLTFDNDIQTHVNSALSEISADHERDDAMIADMRQTGLVVDAVDVSSVSDADDKRSVVEHFQSDWSALITKYEAISIPWLDRMKVLHLAWRWMKEWDSRVFLHQESTPADWEKFETWDKEMDAK